MADEEENSAGGEAQGQAKSKFPVMMMGMVLVVVIAVVMVVMTMKNDRPELEVNKQAAEYAVKEKIYQLKDGSYLRLGFSIVVDADKVDQVKDILEGQSPGRLPDGIHMLLGNKSRSDLINGAHKREAFARELKKMLEEQVFGNFNKRQESSQEQIEVRDVILSDYITQSG
jgi:hypothetical protein